MMFTPADKRSAGASRQRERDRKFADSPLEERVSCELVSGNPNFAPKKSFGGIPGYQRGVSGSIGAHRAALSGSEIKRLRIFAPYTRACTRVRPTKRARSSNPGGTNFDEARPEGSTYRPQRLGMFRTKGRKYDNFAEGETRPAEPSLAQI